MFQAWLSRFEERGGRLVAISLQTPHHSLSMAEKNELVFHVLSDYGAMVIDAAGIVRYAHVRGDWAERPEPEEVRARLSELARRDAA